VHVQDVAKTHNFIQSKIWCNWVFSFYFYLNHTAASKFSKTSGFSGTPCMPLHNTVYGLAGQGFPVSGGI